MTDLASSPVRSLLLHALLPFKRFLECPSLLHSHSPDFLPTVLTCSVIHHASFNKKNITASVLHDVREKAKPSYNDGRQQSIAHKRSVILQIHTDHDVTDQ